MEAARSNHSAILLQLKMALYTTLYFQETELADTKLKTEAASEEQTS